MRRARSSSARRNMSTSLAKPNAQSAAAVCRSLSMDWTSYVEEDDTPKALALLPKVNLTNVIMMNSPITPVPKNPLLEMLAEANNNNKVNVVNGNLKLNAVAPSPAQNNLLLELATATDGKNISNSSSLSSSSSSLNKKSKNAHAATAVGRTLLGRPTPRNNNTIDINTVNHNHSLLLSALSFTASSAADTLVVPTSRAAVTKNTTHLKSCLSPSRLPSFTADTNQHQANNGRNEIILNNNKVNNKAQQQQPPPRTVSFSHFQVREYEVLQPMMVEGDNAPSLSSLGWRYNPREIITRLDNNVGYANSTNNNNKDSNATDILAADESHPNHYFSVCDGGYEK